MHMCWYYGESCTCAHALKVHVTRVSKAGFLLLYTILTDSIGEYEEWFLETCALVFVFFSLVNWSYSFAVEDNTNQSVAILHKGSIYYSVHLLSIKLYFVPIFTLSLC